MGSQLTPTKQRLRDMGTLLLWEGELDNARLRSVFGVQAVQASRLLASMQAEYGDALARATPHAPVTPTRAFARGLSASTPDDYLAVIEAARHGDVAPFVEDLRLDLAPVSQELFARVNQACRRKTGLLIEYRSMAHPEGGERLVFPHAMIRAARRWHMRAWCEQRQDFRDFALGRVGVAKPVEAVALKGQHDDAGWTQSAKLVVIAHPGLDAERARLLNDEYLGGRVERVVRVRRCLVSYTVQDLRLATAVKKQFPPEYQLALKNVKDFKDDFAVREQPVAG